MAITYSRIEIGKLNPAAYNPRRITKTAEANLAASLERFGVVEPIVWNKRTGNVVGGHQRLRILKQRGDTEVDVAVVDLASAEEKALNVALNNPDGQGIFTSDLGPLLGEIKAELDSLDFASLGFEQLAVDFSARGKKTVTFDVKADGDGEDEAPVDLPPATVRMVQLFLSAETLPAFAAAERELRALYGTKNTTETVYRVVLDAAAANRPTE